MKKYTITVTKTGEVTVEASSPSQAMEYVNRLSDAEIEKNGHLCAYQATDVEEVPRPEFYYELCLKDHKKCFFRAGKEIRMPKEITQYAVAGGYIPAADAVECPLILPEPEYRRDLLQHLIALMHSDDAELEKQLSGMKPQEVKEYAGKILVYSDILNVFDNEEEDGFDLQAIETLVKKKRPLEYLYDAYCKTDNFGETYYQYLDLINECGWGEKV